MTVLQKGNKTGTNFLKRWRTVKKKLEQLHKEFEADIYIQIRRRGQVYVASHPL